MVNGPPTGPSPLEQRDRLVGTNGVSKVPSNNTFKKHYPDRETDTSTVIILDCDSGGGDSVDKFNTNSLLERLLVFRWLGSCRRSSCSSGSISGSHSSSSIINSSSSIGGNRCQSSDRSFQPRRSSALGQIHDLWCRETRSKRIQSNV